MNSITIRKKLIVSIFLYSSCNMAMRIKLFRKKRDMSIY